MTLYLFFILPLLVTGLFHHFFVIKRNFLSFLTIPVDLGMNIRGKRLFGDKKTLRGFLVVTILNAIFTVLLARFLNIEIPLRYNLFVTGALVGFAYSLAELPNSFLKRQLGIAPSKKGKGTTGKVFNFIDQADSVTGSVIMANFVTPLTTYQSIVLLLIGVSLHMAVDSLLYRISYKRSLKND